MSDPAAAAAALHLSTLGRSARTGRWLWIRERDHRYRLVCSPSWPLRVAQLLGKDVLAHAHVPAGQVADWPGRGPLYHLRRIIADLERGNVVLLADVRNCFQSVQPDAVYGLGCLPSDLTASCFDVRRIRLRAPSRNSSPIGYTFERTGRHGLLSGGSASSLMWAMMIDDLPGALPAGVKGQYLRRRCRDRLPFNAGV